MRPIFATVGPITLSNVFMTIAWHFHLKQEGWPLRKANLISFGLLIAAVVVMFQD